MDVRLFAERQPELAERGVRMRDDGKIQVEIVGPEGVPGVADALIAPLGAEVSNRYLNRVEAWIPIGQLSAVAARLPAGHFVERVGPKQTSQHFARMRLLAVISQIGKQGAHVLRTETRDHNLTALRPQTAKHPDSPVAFHSATRHSEN